MARQAVAPLSSRLPRKLRRQYNTQFLREHFLGKTRCKRLFSGAYECIKKEMREYFVKSDKGKKISVAEVDDLTPEAFFANYGHPGIPVVFRQKAKDWQACRQWNFDYFSQTFGLDPVLFVNHDIYGKNTQADAFEVSTLKECIDTLEKGNSRYARFHPLLERYPQLLDSLDLQWLNEMMFQKSFGGFIFHVLFLGGAGTKTPIHNAGNDNFFLQIEGEKKWFLWPPDYRYIFHPEANRGPAKYCDLDPLNPDLTRYPGYDHLDYYETTLYLGDILYIPAYVWHYVQNLTNSIGVGTRWTSLKNTFRRSAFFASLEFFNTNPSLFHTMFSRDEFDFNRLIIKSMGYTKVEIDKKIKDHMNE